MNLVVAVVFGLVAVVCLGYGLGLLVVRTHFALVAEQATGEVIAHRPVGRTVSATQTEVGMTYEPVVRFADRHGDPVDFESAVSTWPPRYRTGHPVEVLYDPRRPTRACLLGDQGSLLSALGFVALGVLFAGVSFVGILFT